MFIESLFLRVANPVPASWQFLCGLRGRNFSAPQGLDTLWK